ncbi:hypothetical protein CTAYLR_010684 [Chrysophaeum taylorii]|uniref:Rab-GAP TBC domain-containing protein n=1 Tax=Chrysophaeum taylorii TaxID=2483200 RepID=A0AAD7UA36_9STRA|nr:hypothetical protein CTAYLR_010684 [Chrysophaeum taylorii]
MEARVVAALDRGEDRETVRGLVGSGVPGLPESVRLKLWSVLLGPQPPPARRRESPPPQEVVDSRTLEADVRRTRQGEELFRSEIGRERLRSLLVTVCERRGVAYVQGLNEIAAPVAALWDGRDPLGHAVFSGLVGRVWGLYAQDSLLHASRLYGSLVAYHDPGLASRLCDAGLSPAVYATPWLVTLMTRPAATTELAHRVLDVVLASDAATVFFLGLAVLRSRRRAFVDEPVSDAPRALASLTLDAPDHFAAVVGEARALARATPESLKEALRKAARGAGDGSFDRLLELTRSENTTKTTKSSSLSSPNSLSEPERKFWLPAVVVSATELADSLGTGLCFKVIDVAAFSGSRLATGRLDDAISPPPTAADHHPRQTERLAAWATARICGDATLQGRHLLVVANDETRFLRGDALSEIFLPRPLRRRLLLPADDLDDTLVDPVAHQVASSLRTTGVPRVSTLERGGFEKFVELLVSKNRHLRAKLPAFDPKAWHLYLKRRRRVEYKEDHQGPLAAANRAWRQLSTQLVPGACLWADQQQQQQQQQPGRSDHQQPGRALVSGAYQQSGHQPGRADPQAYPFPQFL